MAITFRHDAAAVVIPPDKDRRKYGQDLVMQEQKRKYDGQQQGYDRMFALGRDAQQNAFVQERDLQIDHFQDLRDDRRLKQNQQVAEADRQRAFMEDARKQSGAMIMEDIKNGEFDPVTSRKLQQNLVEESEALGNPQLDATQRAEALEKIRAARAVLSANRQQKPPPPTPQQQFEQGVVTDPATGIRYRQNSKGDYEPIAEKPQQPQQPQRPASAIEAFKADEKTMQKYMEDADKELTDSEGIRLPKVPGRKEGDKEIAPIPYTTEEYRKKQKETAEQLYDMDHNTGKYNVGTPSSVQELPGGTPSPAAPPEMRSILETPAAPPAAAAAPALPASLPPATPPPAPSPAMGPDLTNLEQAVGAEDAAETAAAEQSMRELRDFNRKMQAFEKPPSAREFAEIKFGDRRRYAESPDAITIKRIWEASRSVAFEPEVPDATFNEALQGQGLGTMGLPPQGAAPPAAATAPARPPAAAPPAATPTPATPATQAPAPQTVTVGGKPLVVTPGHLTPQETQAKKQFMELPREERIARLMPHHPEMKGQTLDQFLASPETIAQYKQLTEEGWTEGKNYREDMTEYLDEALQEGVLNENGKGVWRNDAYVGMNVNDITDPKVKAEFDKLPRPKTEAELQAIRGEYFIGPDGILHRTKK